MTPKIVSVMCPECGYTDAVAVIDKATLACNRCNWPVEVYRDGTLRESALAQCRGTVTPNGGGMCVHPVRTI